eukprot:TRINITY_DN19103_c0_g2_i3.p2 TRINITY_DN19103_c0_g2~~TRINITY_DN19103_c0_g2_i3.p2  ORF type:complete len:138 (-),score=16.62 TRINITY_DN19103_c0_g2_i3:705-1118(-)
MGVWESGIWVDTPSILMRERQGHAAIKKHDDGQSCLQLQVQRCVRTYNTLNNTYYQAKPCHFEVVGAVQRVCVEQYTHAGHNYVEHIQKSAPKLRVWLGKQDNKKDWSRQGRVICLRILHETPIQCHRSTSTALLRK